MAISCYCQLVPDLTVAAVCRMKSSLSGQGLGQLIYSQFIDFRFIISYDR